MTEIAAYFAAFILTYLGVEKFRRWSLRKNFFDIPNERSSHRTPTPRGGGVVIVFICLISYATVSIFVTGNFSWSYFAGAVLIALISWLDDLSHISFVWRFLVHSIAAVLVIYELGFYESLYFPLIGTVQIGVLGAAAAYLWIVWLTNAYNFMDGIDGIAGLQAVTAGIGWLLAGKILGFENAGIYGGFLAFSAIGFLIHNWQPAKIFMGDVGSAYLGYTFAVIPILAGREAPEVRGLMPIVGIFLVWFFIFDTLLTFLVRLSKGKKVWTAHREHLYQKMVINGSPHGRVAVIYGVFSAVILTIMLFWLLYGKHLLLVVLFFLITETAAIYFLSLRNKNVDRYGE